LFSLGIVWSIWQCPDKLVSITNPKNFVLCMNYAQTYWLCYPSTFWNIKVAGNNCIPKEMRCTVTSRSPCHHSVQNILFMSSSSSPKSECKGIPKPWCLKVTFFLLQFLEMVAVRLRQGLTKIELFIIYVRKQHKTSSIYGSIWNYLFHGS